MVHLPKAVLALLITSAASESVSWFQTAASTADRLSEKTPLSFSSQSSNDGVIEITIDTSKVPTDRSTDLRFTRPT